MVSWTKYPRACPGTEVLFFLGFLFGFFTADEMGEVNAGARSRYARIDLSVLSESHQQGSPTLAFCTDMPRVLVVIPAPRFGAPHILPNGD